MHSSFTRIPDGRALLKGFMQSTYRYLYPCKSDLFISQHLDQYSAFSIQFPVLYNQHSAQHRKTFTCTEASVTFSQPFQPFNLLSLALTFINHSTVFVGSWEAFLPASHLKQSFIMSYILYISILYIRITPWTSSHSSLNPVPFTIL